MPTLPIPLFSKSYKNADGSVLTDDSYVQYNGYIDALNGLNIRPGETLAINTGLKNDGLFFWPDKNYIVCVEDGNVALRNISGSTLTTFSSNAATYVPGTPIIFCNDSSYVYMAGGGKINYVDVSGNVTELADVDAPTGVTHVAFLDGYILALNGQTGKFYWSDINVGSSWSALSFATAEGNPDNGQALQVVQRQIYLLGTTTVEIWENDGTTPFSRIPGGIIEVGCIAKYSPVKRDNTLMWLDHRKRFVEFTGTSLKYISSRYDKEISNFSTVSDCIGGLIYKDGQEFCVFQFPGQGRTLVYNPAIDDWSEWGNWDSSGANWTAYDFRSAAYDINGGKTFVGKEKAQAIACLSSDSRVDLAAGSTTNPFKFLRQTGHIDHGTGQRKILEELRFRAKRGAGSSSVTNPKLMLRYRNNGSNQWSNIREIDLGNIGDATHHVYLKRLGMFKSRQYEISATDNVPIVLSNAEIDITLLR